VTERYQRRQHSARCPRIFYALFAQRAAGGDPSSSVNRLQNKKQVRITVDGEWLKTQDRFYKFTRLLQIYGEPALYGKVLGVMGWVKPETLSDSALRRWTKSPKLKHDTWFVHQGVLPVEQILSIAFMEKPDISVPYDFETHGRPELERNGLYSISAAELDALNEYEQHAPFINGSVVIICPNSKAPPAIVFRKRHSALVLNIQTGECIQREGCLFSDDDAVRFGIWTRCRSEYLMSLWDKSKARGIISNSIF
jgi:hypothetical protein